MIWVALTLTPFLYYGIGTKLLSPHESNSQSLFQVQIFTVLGIALGVASFIYWRFFFSEVNLRKILKNPKNPTQTEDTADDVTTSSDSRLLRIFPKYLVSCIICWSVNESIALLGLILMTQAQDPVKTVPFLLIAVSLNLVMFPRPTKIVERCRYVKS